MAKFIIEIDDDLIREKANQENAKKDVEGDKNILKCLFDFVAMTAIKKRLDKGETEFHVTRDMMDDDQKKDFFDRNITDICMMAVFAKVEENNDEKKEGN